MLRSRRVVRIAERRADRDVHDLELDAGKLAQPRQVTRANGDRYRHEPILGDEYVHLFS
jgi:hypothetical protein